MIYEIDPYPEFNKAGDEVASTQPSSALKKLFNVDRLTREQPMHTFIDPQPLHYA